MFGILEFSLLSTPLTSRSFSRRVLGFALADGPVFKPDIDEVDEDILGADARCLSEPLDDRLVERLLRSDSTDASSVDQTETRCLAPKLPSLMTVPSGISRTADGLCETVIRLSTRLGLIEVFLNHASQVGKQAVALPPV
jgi:hypothetical protein